MLRMGVPRSAICLKMLADGVSERDVRIFETEGLEDLSEEGMAARRAASRDGVTTLFLKLPGRAGADAALAHKRMAARDARGPLNRSPTRSCSRSIWRFVAAASARRRTRQLDDLIASRSWRSL